MKYINEIAPFEGIFSAENLLRSFYIFKKGKKDKKDVAEFSMRLAENILVLHHDIMSGAYHHGGYEHFKIADPKPRDIHKASVRDRVVHHTIYRALYSYFDRKFIHDSYSCRIGKGVHKATKRFEAFAKKEGLNNTRTAWVLKGDIRKCFASVDHNILKGMLGKELQCARMVALLDEVIDSFSAGEEGKGIPLGNLTSQLFINIYLNEFDQYMKRVLKTKYYIRYADDFVVLSHDKNLLVGMVPLIEQFLVEHLHLILHPDKLFIRTVSSGVDFLGWVHFLNSHVLRTVTKKRMQKALTNNLSEAVKSSYNGLLLHGDTYKLRRRIGCWD